MVAQVLARALDMVIAQRYPKSPMARVLSRLIAAINSATDTAVLFDLIQMCGKKALNEVGLFSFAGLREKNPGNFSYQTSI